MSYYKYECDGDTYHSLNFPSPEPWDWLIELDGSPLGEQWEPLHVGWYKQSNSGNFPYFAHDVPIFDRKACEALVPLIRSHVEVLPLVHAELGEGVFYAINVLTALDCLDERSTIRRFEEGNIMSVDKYVFREDVIGDTPIFRIKEIPSYGIYPKRSLSQTS